MLDRVEEVNVEVPSLVASAKVPQTSPVFEGHFPGHPLMPGVLLLETMAQAAGYLLLSVDGFSRMPFFASAKEANFRAFVRPGACCAITSPPENREEVSPWLARFYIRAFERPPGGWCNCHFSPIAAVG